MYENKHVLAMRERAAKVGLGVIWDAERKWVFFKDGKPVSGKPKRYHYAHEWMLGYEAAKAG